MSDLQMLEHLLTMIPEGEWKAREAHYYCAEVSSPDHNGLVWLGNQHPPVNNFIVAHFIAAARNQLPALIEELKILRAERVEGK